MGGKVGSRAAAAIAALLLASCSDAGAPEPEAEPVALRDAAASFAPLVRVDRRERAFPVSAAYFLAQSGLEWSGGPCSPERDVTASASSRAAASQPIPLLDPRRLGREPAYRVRDAGPGCSPRNVYSTVQRTRAFDSEDRPVGLQLDEAFNLDILTDAQAGELRTTPDGSLARVPAYYALEETGAGPRPGLRIGYWLVFGREYVPTPGPRSWSLREGDWERIDVLAERAGRGRRYRPIAVEYRLRERTLRVPWSEVERAGPGGTHPIAQLDSGSHTPRPPGRCEDCVDWKTWRLLRDVRHEPWWGYGGGWGSVGPTDESSGPLGPSPFEIGTPPGSRERTVDDLW